VIVYDEATSSLDALTEENVLRSLKKAFVGKTSLVIAHRLSAVVDADIIYVLEGGKISEAGTHFELLNRPGGVYAELWNSQHRRAAYSTPNKIEKPKENLIEFETNGCCRQSTCNR
jgi:ATP-binding cassette subfamily B (MDR/TAP) protein 7